MASTTSKNTPGNYQAEQRINTGIDNYAVYVNSASAEAYTNHLAGNGLLAGRNARSTLCNNYVDVESQLFGIGTTNLVNPYVPVQPSLQRLSSLNIIDKIPLMLPDPLVVDQTQRPSRT